MGTDVVGDGADGQRFRAELRRHAVDTRRFHFHAQNAVFFHHVEHGRVRRIEQVCGEDVADARVNAQRFRRVYRITHHAEIGNRRKIMVFETQTVHFRVGARAHADHHVTQFDIFTHRAAGAHADDFLHAEIGDQLFGVDRAGRDTHPVAHHGDFAAFIGTGEAQHAAHVVHFTHVFEEGFCNVLRAQRVARHQNDVSEIAHFCVNVRSCHLQFLLHCCFCRVAATPYPAYKS